MAYVAHTCHLASKVSFVECTRVRCQIVESASSSTKGEFKERRQTGPVLRFQGLEQIYNYAPLIQILNKIINLIYSHN